MRRTSKSAANLDKTAVQICRAERLHASHLQVNEPERSGEPVTVTITLATPNSSGAKSGRNGNPAPTNPSEPYRSKAGPIELSPDGVITVGRDCPGRKISTGVRPKTEPLEMKPENLNEKEINLAKAMLLAVSYSSSLGGVVTLTGTPPNLIMVGQLNQHYGRDHPVDFSTWFAYQILGLFINLAVLWVLLQVLFLNWRSIFRKGVENPFMKAVLRKEYKDLGPIRFEEYSVVAIFVVLIFLWLTQGKVWGKFFTFNDIPYSSDTTCVIVIVLVVFAWPKFRPSLSTAHPGLISFETVRKGVAWGVILLLGAGFAVGRAVSESGLAKLIAVSLAKMKLSKEGLCAVAVIIVTYLTEVTSNTATSSLVLPIVIALANQRCINPLYLALPIAEAASFAFMLPVGTPPNSIVFSTGLLRVQDMLLAGFIMSIVGFLECMLAVNTWGLYLFDLQEFPEWARTPNNTNCFPL